MVSGYTENSYKGLMVSGYTEDSYKGMVVSGYTENILLFLFYIPTAFVSVSYGCMVEVYRSQRKRFFTEMCMFLYYLP